MDNARLTLRIIAVLSLIAGIIFPVVAIVANHDLGATLNVVQVLGVAFSGLATWAFLTVFSGIAGEIEQMRLSLASELEQIRLNTESRR